jgi:hypothetical protein
MTETEDLDSAVYTIIPKSGRSVVALSGEILSGSIRQKSDSWRRDRSSDVPARLGPKAPALAEDLGRAKATTQVLTAWPKPRLLACGVVLDSEGLGEKGVKK